jgi:hypothetical protein
MAQGEADLILANDLAKRLKRFAAEWLRLNLNDFHAGSFDVLRSWNKVDP